MREALGRLFIEWRKKANVFKWIMFAFLALCVILNFFIHPHHPHVEEEKYAGFWALFGFGSAVVMIYVIKKWLANLLGVSEDFYERD